MLNQRPRSPGGACSPRYTSARAITRCAQGAPGYGDAAAIQEGLEDQNDNTPATA